MKKDRAPRGPKIKPASVVLYAVILLALILVVAGLTYRSTTTWEEDVEYEVGTEEEPDDAKMGS